MPGGDWIDEGTLEKVPGKKKVTKKEVKAKKKGAYAPNPS